MHNVRRIAAHWMPLLGVILVACGSDGPGTSDGEAEAARDSAETAGVVAIDSATRSAEAVGVNEAEDIWDTSVTNVGAGLVLYSEGTETLRLACVRDSREMTLDVPIFSSIESEERLSFGFEGDSYIFVASVTPAPPSGVHAARPIEEDFLAAFAAAHQISAVYGSQSTGPHAVPDPSALDLFLGACRQAMGG